MHCSERERAADDLKSDRLPAARTFAPKLDTVASARRLRDDAQAPAWSSRQRTVANHELACCLRGMFEGNV